MPAAPFHCKRFPMDGRHSYRSMKLKVASSIYSILSWEAGKSLSVKFRSVSLNAMEQWYWDGLRKWGKEGRCMDRQLHRNHFQRTLVFSLHILRQPMPPMAVLRLVYKDLGAILNIYVWKSICESLSPGTPRVSGQEGRWVGVNGEINKVVPCWTSRTTVMKQTHGLHDDSICHSSGFYSEDEEASNLLFKWYILPIPMSSMMLTDKALELNFTPRSWYFLTGYSKVQCEPEKVASIIQVS